MIKSIVSAILIITLFSFSALAQDNKKFTHVKYGVGYSFIGNNLILGQPLELASPNAPFKPKISHFDDQCFKNPGVSGVENIKIKDQNQFARLVKIFSLTNGILELKCGATTTNTDAFIIVSEDNIKWFIFNNASNAMVNRYIKDMAMHRWADGVGYTKTKSPFEVSEIAGDVLNVKPKNVSLSFGMLANQDKILAYFDTEYPDSRKALIKYIEKEGFKVHKKMSEGKMYRTLVELNKLDRANFLSQINTGLDLTHKFYRKQLEFYMDSIAKRVLYPNEK